MAIIVINRAIPLLAACFALASAGGAAPAAPTRTIPGTEAPELGRQGPLPVGTRAVDLTMPDRLRISPGGITRADRTIGLRFWYPATVPAGATRVTYRHLLQLPLQPAWTWTDDGQAVEGAPLRKGPKAPLVLISHGFGGWSTHLSRLAETLASKGYVVASIDHRDMRFDSVPTFLLSFGSVLADRAEDQRQVLRRLLSSSWPVDHPMTAADPVKVGLIGYSMGGYGALATAGAVPDAAATGLAQLPEEARTQAVRADPATAGLIKSIVLIAPWGGQSDNRVWRPESLARVTAPTLVVGGDRDPVVKFDTGIRWIFDSLRSTSRRLLVYREAQHNIAGNAASIGERAPAGVSNYLRDPVWRGDRINQINQHFITAFLDLTLRGDRSRSAYLDVATAVAADGTWPVPFGEQTDGLVAGPGQPNYWRGFQRGSAVGLELHAKRAGE